MLETILFLSVPVQVGGAVLLVMYLARKLRGRVGPASNSGDGGASIASYGGAFSDGSGGADSCSTGGGGDSGGCSS